MRLFFNMSFSGGILILVILVIRALAINRLPKKTFLALWGVALTRLLIPFTLPSSFSVYNLFRHMPGAEIPMEPFLLPAPVPMAQTMGNTVPSTSGFHVPLIVWLIGAAVCALVFCTAYHSFRRKFRMSFPVRNEYVNGWLDTHKLQRTIAIRQTDQICAPLTYGIFRPVILLPKSIDWNNTDQLDFMLAHEYIHIRHLDSMWKLLLAAGLCAHWFHPIVWVMYFLANRDLELSCDETVIFVFGEKNKSAYARTLIEAEATKSGFAPSWNAFNKNAVEERIRAIMKIKTTTTLSFLLACTVVAGTVGIFATSAMGAEGYSTTFVSLEDQPVQGNPQKPTREELRSRYGAYGITVDEKEGSIFFYGERVRYFMDGAELGEGMFAVRYEYYHKEGTVDIRTQYTQKDNGDGSYDPLGTMTGIEQYSQEEFAQRDVSRLEHPAETITFAMEGIDTAGGQTFAQRFEKYRGYGIEYKEKTSTGGRGNVYYKGRLVKTFIDENKKGGVFSYQSQDGGELTVRVVYNEVGRMIGVKAQ